MGKKKPSKNPVLEPASDSDEDVSNFTNTFMSKREDLEQSHSNLEINNEYDSDNESESSDTSDQTEKGSVQRQLELKRRLSGDSDSESDSSVSDEDKYLNNTSEIPSDHIENPSQVQTKSKKRKVASDSLESEHLTRDSYASSSDDEKDGQGEEQEETTEDGVDEQFKKLRKELADFPFEDLQKLKEKIGVKMYNQTMFGSKQGRQPKTDFKRANKNRPREMSSKKSVGRFREVIPVAKKVHRDPRFDDLSGTYSEDIFKQNYAFMSDVKQREKAKLLKSYKKEKDEEKKKQLKFLINRMNQQENTEKQKEKTQAREREIKKKEREMVSEGKTPFYLKQSEKKKLELAERYRELKKSGKIDKYMTKKRKKNASKEKKKLPKGFTK